MKTAYEILSEPTLVESFRRANPEYTDINLKEINAGTVSYVYEVGDGATILHVNPDYSPDDSLVQAVIEPHSVPNKGKVLYDRLSCLRLPDNPGDRIEFTSPLTYGTFNHNNTSYNYWTENRLNGNSLSHVNEKLNYEEYRHLIEWVASLQKLNTDPTQTQSLRTYYEERWTRFVDFLDENSMIEDPEIQEILLNYYRAIHDSIGADEQTSFIHGDLMPGNILLNEAPDRRTIGLIDFERSVCYGDPLADALKLLQLKHEYIPPHPEYSYTLELTNEQKLDLAMCFLTVRDGDQGSDEKRLEILKGIVKRDILIHTDTILSIIAYRTYNKNSKMGNTDTLKEYFKQYLLEVKEAGIFSNEQ